MKLKGRLSSNFKTRCVDNTEITDVKSTITTDNHELRFPELFVVGNHKMIAITFTNLVLSRIAIEAYLEILKFISVNLGELKRKFVLLSCIWKETESSTRKVKANCCLLSCQRP
jgi:hypothetical protein